MRSFAVLVVLGPIAVSLAACAASTVNEPSLARRPAEAIDPRIPIPPNPVPGPADPALASRLGALVAEGKAGAATFEAELGRTQSLAEAAGPAQSESWIIAQEALSGLEGARSKTTRAVADIDELAAVRVQSGAGLTAGDQIAIEAASAELRTVTGRQSAVVDQLTARLAR
ncbi:MAG: hypothetical protein ABI617_03400 [Sphingomicrobium sp.]